jgi:trans-2,3-dihydro-3-hydroxyanthranilate isomerase
MAAAGVDLAWCFTPAEGGYRARMFAPTAGVPEDPATGSAVAIFAAELAARGRLRAEGATRIDIRQGLEMGRPSRIGLTVLAEGGRVVQVRVAGAAVRIASGRIAVPP